MNVVIWDVQVEHPIGGHWKPHVLRVDCVIGRVLVDIHVLGIRHSTLHNIELQITVAVVCGVWAKQPKKDEKLPCCVWYSIRYTDGVGVRTRNEGVEHMIPTI